jgi:hypothetical protein
MLLNFLDRLVQKLGGHNAHSKLMKEKENGTSAEENRLECEGIPVVTEGLLVELLGVVWVVVVTVGLRILDFPSKTQSIWRCRERGARSSC